MDSPIFKVEYRQQGTTEKQAKAAEKRREESVTPWTELVDYYLNHDNAEFEFLLLAARRRTDLGPQELADELGIEVEETLFVLKAGEDQIKASRQYARRFSEFLDGFDGDDREQACTVQEDFAMTFEEIGLSEGWAWQNPQQDYERAIAKIRANPEALKALLGKSYNPTMLRVIMEAL